TLRGAARVLAVDQATVGRRLAPLERSLGATLFLRTSTGYSLTAAREIARAAAPAMESSAADPQRQILGKDERISGGGRGAPPHSCAADFITPAVAALHREEPGIEVQLQTSTQMLNLSKREADIAVRTHQPENPELIVRRLARWGSGLFASP